MKTEAPIYTGEITNGCTCTKYDPITEEYTDEPSDYCDASCWEFAVEDFENVTEELRDANETGWWKVSNLRLWNGEVSGFFHANKVEDILRGMAVNSHWIMNYKVFGDRIEYSLSHHDAPMGSSSVLTPVSADYQEEAGLF